MMLSARQDHHGARMTEAASAYETLPVEHMTPVVTPERARELLSAPKFPRLARFWHALRLNDPHLKAQPRKQECLWMPFYHVRIVMTARGEESTLDTTVDSWSGSFAIVSFESPIEDGLPPGEHFPPRMAPQEAESRAYQELLHTVMRQRSRGSKPMPQTVADSRLIYWPFWVIYIQKKRYLDLRLMDAVTAQPGGNRTKVGMLDAFTAAHASTRKY